MAFIKNGDAIKINNIIDNDEILKCTKCGKEINTLKIEQNKNEAVCDCDLENEEEI